MKSLVSSGLLNVFELDAQISKQLETGAERTLEFCVNLMHACLVGEDACVTFTELYYSLLNLHKLHSTKKLPERYGYRLIDGNDKFRDN